MLPKRLELPTYPQECDTPLSRYWWRDGFDKGYAVGYKEAVLAAREAEQSVARQAYITAVVALIIAFITVLVSYLR